MTVKDPIIHIRFGNSEIVLAGTPDEYAVRSNNNELTKLVKSAIKTPALVKYGNRENNIYATGGRTMEQLFLSVVSVMPEQAIIIEVPDSVDVDKFWVDEKLPNIVIEIDNGIVYRKSFAAYV